MTREKTIDWEGEELPYSQYLTDIAGAGVSALAAVPPLDEGSYVVFQALNYPGQNQPVQEAGTGSSPLQVLQRVIKQSVKYSLQGTTQGRYLTGGVPPVRFSM